MQVYLMVEYVKKTTAWLILHSAWKQDGSVDTR